MARTNQIHPTAVIGDDVVMGEGNVIGPHAVILGPCTIGDNNWFGPHVGVGAPGEFRGREHPSFDEPQGFGISFGNGCVVREFVTVQQGSYRNTSIADDVYLMARSHVPHDAILEEGVTLACAAQVGGHGWVGAGANVGLGSQIVQRSAIGGLAMIGMNSSVTRDVPPFALMMGAPARIKGVNRVGLSRAGIDDDTIGRLEVHYQDGNREAPDWLPDPLAVYFERFAEYSSRPIAK